MITAKKRMVPPEAAQDSRLLPLAKRAVFIAMHQVAEDSGCLLWDARDIHAVAFPIDPEHTLEDVERFMGELEADKCVWCYDIDGVACAYLPSFQTWQSSLTRLNAPQIVPLPLGITFEANESKNRNKSGNYSWPISEREMNDGRPYRLPGKPPPSEGKNDD